MTEREQARGWGLFLFSFLLSIFFSVLFLFFCCPSWLPRLPCLNCCLLMFWTLFWALLLLIPGFLASGARRWGGYRYRGADIKGAVGTAAYSSRATIRSVTGTGTSPTAGGSRRRGGDGGAGGGFFNQAMSSSGTIAVVVSAKIRVRPVVLCIQAICTRS